MDRRVRAQILTVGDELLSGAVVDTNLTRIGRFLDEFGVDRANERNTYYSDAEYAAAILNVDLEWLKQNFRLDN